jgi:hypothetical protein
MTVGGRPFDFDKERILKEMRGVEPDPIREHLVEVGGGVFPPKQVLAVVTGWDRKSFTTMEAQRVLTKVGFLCRRAGGMADGAAASVQAHSGSDPGALDGRVAALEAGLVVANQAIAALTSRLSALERQG